ncbi:MAG: hypothetical protein RI924_926, partial [Bacteroidota bacterium]
MLFYYFFRYKVYFCRPKKAACTGSTKKRVKDHFIPFYMPNTGKIAQIIGPVVDVSFAENAHLPKIYD